MTSNEGPKQQGRRAFLEKFGSVAAVGATAAIGGAAGVFAEKKLNKTGEAPIAPDATTQWFTEQQQIWQVAIQGGDKEAAAVAMDVIVLHKKEVQRLADLIAELQKAVVEKNYSSGQKALVNVIIFQSQERINWLRTEIDVYSHVIESSLKQPSPENPSDEKMEQFKSKESSLRKTEI